MSDWQEGLTSYQRACVAHLLQVYRQHNICLVADEVGLGKTYIAKALIQALDARRVIYVASNPQVARQNVLELARPDRHVVTGADRLSMYRAENTGQGVYIYPLSPATTFTGRGSPFGNRQERNFYWDNRRACQGVLPLNDPTLAFLHKSQGEESQADRQDLRRLRVFFNDRAVRLFSPDLIILDEFHRFHDLLEKPSPQGEGPDYSMYRMLEVLNLQRRGQGRQPVKLLLLSATPYHMKKEGFDTRSAAQVIHPYEGEQEDTASEADSTGPFENFGKLKEYMTQLDQAGDLRECPYPRDGGDYDALYRHMMCRTQRDWLLEGFPPAGVTDLVDLKDRTVSPLLTGHLAYRLAYQRDALPSPAPGSPAEGRQKGIEAMAQVLNAPSAMASYGALRTFLDETPEFLQFCDGYKSIQGSQAADAARTRFSRLLEHTGYRLRREAGGEPCPAPFAQVRGHYKFSLLLEHAMPEQSELLLWVPPSLPRTPLPRLEGLGLQAFSKTLVFAHYRMSTRATAALTSMEAQLRLLARIGPAEIPHRVDLSPILPQLLEPAAPLLAPLPAQTQNGLRRELEEAMSIFFNTTHARRVLTAYAAGLGQAAGPHTLLDYCREMGWGDVIWEYLECLNALRPLEGDPAALILALCGVLNWGDEDRTRVLVLPDWSASGYPCTFGERYAEDYSDKKSHDGDRGGTGKRNTSKRLGWLMDRFQSPFYPFILAASETAQEGVNLHHYCQTLFHWSVPSTLNALVQEEGRVDRRGSLTVRRQMAWLYRRAAAQGRTADGPVTLARLFQPETALELCGAGCRPLAERGLFPAWYLPRPEGEDFPKLRRVMAALPQSREEADFQTLLSMQEQYNSFGLHQEDEARKLLCPLLREPLMD